MVQRIDISWPGFATVWLLSLFLMTPYSGLAMAGDKEIVIAAFGDSLSAGYKLPQDQSFPAQLEKALRAKGHKVIVLNAAVSGDTTTGGLARLDWSVGKEVEGVIVELGANDALRGVDPKLTKENLTKIVRRFKERKISVLLTGMEAPRGMGDDYVNAFRALFADIAKMHETLLYPFFLDGIALKPEYSLSDGMHPNGKGVAEVVRRILPSVEKLLEQVRAARPVN